MTTMQLLREPHNLKKGQHVYIYKRNKPEIKYTGNIYKIYSQPLQQSLLNSPYIDYIYVSLDDAVYSKLLMRGWSVIYKGEQRVIGDVEKNDQCQITRLFIQSKFFMIEDQIINMKDIDAILVWRVAFAII